MADEDPRPEPVFHDGFPAFHRGAYCLSYGIVDRLREPFPTSPRPVWPWRPLFTGEHNDREPITPRRDGFVRPFDEHASLVPTLPVTVDGRADFEAIPVDDRALSIDPDTSPRIQVHGHFPDAYLDFVLYTELGYEPAPWRAAGEAEVHEISLVELGRLQSDMAVATPGAVLQQTADFGATRAYLEVRAVRIADGKVLAASPLLLLAWEREFVDRMF